MLRDSSHTNIAHLFGEDDRRRPNEDSLTVVPGFLGSYPNALFRVTKRDLGELVDAVPRLSDEASYLALRDRFGVLRASEGFWKHSDRINQEHRQAAPLENGLFDYNLQSPRAALISSPS